MKKLKGLIASSGLAVGRVHPIFDRENLDIPTYTIVKEDIEKELKRFESSLEYAIASLKGLQTDTSKLSKEEREILGTHLAMLSDTEFIKSICESVEAKMLNVEAVLDEKIHEYASMLASSPSSYIRERALDIKDAFEGVFEHLLSNREKRNRFVDVPPDSIIVARDIMTSEVLSLKSANVKGIIMEDGGVTGHISIIARSWGIPMLVSVSHAMEYAIAGLEVCLDAEEGVAILNPEESDVEYYKKKIEENAEKFEELQRTSNFATRVQTQDGIEITVSANIALKDEGLSSYMTMADGVGLFRTEFLFLQNDSIPSEEMQEEVYSALASSLKDKPLVIRTFDAGSDKMLKEQENLHEKNPLLGWRAIRYCFARPEIFRGQLRAILKSSVHGNVHILVPMISSISEVRKVRSILEEEKLNLEVQGIPFNPNIPLGIMVEVPSVAVVADLFAPYVDFMSIGTNDLVQYVMATDRENGKVAHLANYFEPAVLRLIKNAICSFEYSKTENYFVSMCGEMASNKEAVFLLLGMGLRHFSMPSWKICEMKNFISQINVKKAREVYDRVVSMSSPLQILDCLQTVLHDELKLLKN